MSSFSREHQKERMTSSHVLTVLILGFAVAEIINATHTSNRTTTGKPWTTPTTYSPEKYVIKCYVCDGLDISCIDPYIGSVNHETDCDRDFSYLTDKDAHGGCSKFKTITKAHGITLATVSRTFGKEYDNTRCFQRNRQITKIVGIKAESWSCTCEGDLCNSAPPLAVTTSAILIVVSALPPYLFY